MKGCLGCSAGVQADFGIIYFDIIYFSIIYFSIVNFGMVYCRCIGADGAPLSKSLSIKRLTKKEPRIPF